MKELVKSILVYVIIVSALKGLVVNPRYRQYFQFLSGLIMILLMLTPVLHLLDCENTWYTVLEEQLLQSDLSEVEEQMQIADGKFAAVLEKEYQGTVKEQITAMAEKKGLKPETVEVSLHQDGDVWEITEISVQTKRKSRAESGLSVEVVRQEKNQQLRQEDPSKKAAALRRQICDNFVLGEDNVHIWK